MKEKILEDLYNHYLEYICGPFLLGSFFVLSFISDFFNNNLAIFMPSLIAALLLSFILFFTSTGLSFWRIVFSLSKDVKRIKTMPSTVQYKNGFVFSQNYRTFKVLDFKDKTLLLENDEGELQEVSLINFLKLFTWKEDNL